MALIASTLVTQLDAHGDDCEQLGHALGGHLSPGTVTPHGSSAIWDKSRWGGKWTKARWPRPRPSGPRPDRSRKRQPHAAREERIGSEIIGAGCVRHRKRTQVTKSASTSPRVHLWGLAVTFNNFGTIVLPGKNWGGCNVGETMGEQMLKNRIRILGKLSLRHKLEHVVVGMCLTAKKNHNWLHLVQVVYVV